MDEKMKGARIESRDSVQPPKPAGWRQLYGTEDWWAVWIGIGLVIASLLLYAAGASAFLGSIAVSPPKNWTGAGKVLAHFSSRWGWYGLLFLLFGALFGFAAGVLRLNLKQYLKGYVILFLGSLLILVASCSKFASQYNLEAPLLALILGLILGNSIRTPAWLGVSLRTEFYIKTGIVLLGATLPLTLIVEAGPIAFIQATIVSVLTFLTIYFASTRLFKLGPRFGAVLGAAGSVCGVSASIAVGGTVSARKEEIAVGISIVSLWAIIMIFFLPMASNVMNLHPGVAGAWIGTSEFADAAGFAAAAAIPVPRGTDPAINAFTLMKVIGRDIWIGIWCFILSFIAVLVWDKREGLLETQRVGVRVIWDRFPKFVIGFIIAVLIMSAVAARWFPTTELFEGTLQPKIIGPIKTLRTWAFVFTFLCIGLTTRFKDLIRFGWPPFLAFTIGVIINVPLGYLLSNHIFVRFWQALR
jgi:uncharacterized membrane protein YadS